MNRFPTLQLVLSLLGLVLLSSAHIEVAGAESSGLLTEQGPSCQAKPNTGRDAANAGSLADIGAQLAATPIEDDVIPLNNRGYHYDAQQIPSNELIFMDAELQRRDH